jgi:glutamine amidotransferase
MASTPEVVVVDYGMGNVGSIRNMLSKIGVRGVVTGDPDAVARADRLILPGVGAFDEAMQTLRATDLHDALVERAGGGEVPLLGVCLGMQLLLEDSEEGDQKGLGLVPGTCRRFPATVDGLPLLVPHMGWSTVEPVRTSPFLPSLGIDARYYFVHSYYAETAFDEHILGRSTYGVPYTSAVQNGNVAGVQFHPEKSHRHGLRLLADFVGS